MQQAAPPHLPVAPSLLPVLPTAHIISGHLYSIYPCSSALHQHQHSSPLSSRPRRLLYSQLYHHLSLLSSVTKSTQLSAARIDVRPASVARAGMTLPHSSVQIASSSILINSPHMLASVSVASSLAGLHVQLSVPSNWIGRNLLPLLPLYHHIHHHPRSCFPSGAPGLAYTCFPLLSSLASYYDLSSFYYTSHLSLIFEPPLHPTLEPVPHSGHTMRPTTAVSCPVPPVVRVSRDAPRWLFGDRGGRPCRCPLPPGHHSPAPCWPHMVGQAFMQELMGTLRRGAAPRRSRIVRMPGSNASSRTLSLLPSVPVLSLR